jgi:predicted metal-dependent enzyme (double-stranded beta helix superfamily)
MTRTVVELRGVVEDLASRPDAWMDLIRHDPDRRTYALLHEDAEMSVWLLCWSADHDTGFHDHDTSAAAITVLFGNVREDRMRLGGPPASRLVGAGETVTVPPSAIHRVLHAGDGPAVTIHAYSPPLVRTGAYELGADGELLRVAMDGNEELRGELAAV